MGWISKTKAFGTSRFGLQSPFWISLVILVFNGILIAGVWAVVLELIRVERSDAERDAIARNDNLAIALSEYAIRTIENADAVLRYLIRERLAAKGVVDLEKFVRDYTIENAAFAGVVLTDRNGNGLSTAGASEGKFVQSLNIADREHFKAHLERDDGRLLVGKPVAGRITGKIVIPISRRINAPDGSFDGIAVALLEPRRLTGLLEQSRMRKEDVIALVGLDGIARATLKGSVQSWGEDLRRSPILVAQAANPVGNTLTHGALFGVPRYVSYRTLPDYSLIAVVGGAQSDALAEFHQRRTRYLIAADIASAAIVAFALLLLQALAAQRRAAAEVARSQSRFLATFNQATVGITHANLEGRFFDVNKRFCEMLGYSREELLALGADDVTHPDDATRPARARKQLLDATDPTESVNEERRYLRKDGSSLWCQVAVYLVRDNRGQPDYIATMIWDISGRKRADEALRESNRHLHELSGRLVRAEENERGRIARELHDQCGQQLTALTLDLRILEKTCPDQSALISRCLAIASLMLDQVRDLTLALRPSQLDNLGLVSALRDQLEHHVRAHGIEVHVDDTYKAGQVTPDLEAVCFRIAQEAFTNILRHASARNVWLKVSTLGGELLLEVREDGVGFDVDSAMRRASEGHSSGLRNLCDRAELAGGRLEIDSTPGKGTTVRATFPLAA